MTDTRRQLPKNQFPATLQGEHLDKEVNRRRDRDYGGPTDDRHDERDDRRNDRGDRQYDRADRDQDRRNDRGDRQYARADHGNDRDYDRRRGEDRDRRDYDDRRRDDGYDDRDRSRENDERNRGRDHDNRDRRDYDRRDRDDRRDREYDDRRDYDNREKIERDPGFQPMESEPRRPRRAVTELSSPRKVLVLISSIVELFVSFLFIGLGVVTLVLRYYPHAAVPFIAGVTCLVHAACGFHSRRAQGKNTMTVVTTVVSICCVILWACFGAFAYWAGQLLGEPGYQFQFRRPDLGYISVAGACLSVVAIIASMMMVWIGCGVACCAEAPRHSYGQVKTETKKETEA